MLQQHWAGAAAAPRPWESPGAFVLAAAANASCAFADGTGSLTRAVIRRALKAEGVCESVLYGLPFIIRPTSCWQLDWDELETNQHSFHALCHSLLVSVRRLQPRGRDCPGKEQLVHV